MENRCWYTTHSLMYEKLKLKKHLLAAAVLVAEWMSTASEVFYKKLLFVS